MLDECRLTCPYTKHKEGTQAWPCRHHKSEEEAPRMEILGLRSMYKLSHNNSSWKGPQAPVQPPTQNRVNTDFIPVFSGLCQLDLKSLQGQGLAHLSQSLFQCLTGLIGKQR